MDMGIANADIEQIKKINGEKKLDK